MDVVFFNNDGIGYYLVQYSQKILVYLLTKVDSFSPAYQCAMVTSFSQLYPPEYLASFIYPHFVNSNSIAVWLTLTACYSTEQVK